MQPNRGRGLAKILIVKGDGTTHGKVERGGDIVVITGISVKLGIFSGFKYLVIEGFGELDRHIFIGSAVMKLDWTREIRQVRVG